MRNLIVTEFVILVLGTLFAWGNFIYELVNWLNDKACTTGCAIDVTNPFLTPCFYGALFFLIAFIVSALMLARSKK